MASAISRLTQLLDTLMDRHGPEVAHVLHRVTRAGLEVVIIGTVTRLARRHPVAAVAVTLIGLEALDEFAQAHAQQLADWVVQRFINLNADTFRSDGDPFGLPGAA
jgi:hypothetical protein